MNLNKWQQWTVKYVLGTKAGEEVIDFLESGVRVAFTYLVAGDLKGFYYALPVKVRALLAKAIKEVEA